jgi:hypothetical protein
MSTRRTFLGMAGLGTLAAATGTPLFAQGQRPSTNHDPTSDTWDMSWVGRVTGKRRAVFDSPEISEGAGLFRAFLWRDQVKEVYGEGVADSSAVLVIRHVAIPLVMNDEFWGRYEIGKRVKLKNPATRHWFTTNPVRVTPPGVPPQFARYNLENFLSEGGIVLGCDVAFQEIVGTIAQRDRLSQEDADKRAREHLLPGIILQPSGVFAVLTAQEAGCNYILAS